MAKSDTTSNSGNIAIKVTPKSNGSFLFEATPALEGYAGKPLKFHGQNAKHAIAITLENLARIFRLAAEEEQDIPYEMGHRSRTEKQEEKRYHVILHYEWVGEEVSKFEASHNTRMGNTVVENAEISVIQVDPDLPVEALAAKW